MISLNTNAVETKAALPSKPARSRVLLFAVELFATAYAVAAGHPFKSVAGALVVIVTLLAPTAVSTADAWRQQSGVQETERIYSIGMETRHSAYAACERHEEIQCISGYIQSAALLKAAADRGHTKANFEIGKMTCVGWGTEKNPDQAKAYFKNAHLTRPQEQALLAKKAFRDCYLG